MSSRALTISPIAEIVTGIVDLAQEACTIAHPRGLITIGLTSGLGSIACSVLAVSDDKVQKLWSEVMSGPRKRRDVPHQRRYKAHKLMLDMFFDRWPPGVIALGPPSEKTEPLEWIVFMRSAMFELGKSLRVPVVLFDTDAAVARALGAVEGRGGTGLKSLIRREMPRFSSNKRRVILSTATAMAGAMQQRSLLDR